MWRLLRSPADPLDYALAVGGLFAVVSQAIHGFFDFGLYLPANLLLMAVSLRRGDAGARAGELEVTRRGIRRGGAECRVVLVAVFVVGTCPGDSASPRDRSDEYRPRPRPTIPLRRAPPLRTSCGPPSTRSRPDCLRSADDAELHYELAKAWIYLHRSQVVARAAADVHRPPSHSPSCGSGLPPSALHGKAYELLRAGKAQELDALRKDPLVIENLRPALQHLLLARQSCPILAKIHLRLARLCVVAASPTCDAAHARRARRLAPSDPYTFVETGLLDLQAGRIEEACRSWQHALTLSSEDLGDVLAYAWPALDLETIVGQVLPSSPPLLLRLAKQGLPGVPVSRSRNRCCCVGLSS